MYVFPRRLATTNGLQVNPQQLQMPGEKSVCFSESGTLFFTIFSTLIVQTLESKNTCHALSFGGWYMATCARFGKSSMVWVLTGFVRS